MNKLNIFFYCMLCFNLNVQAKEFENYNLTSKDYNSTRSAVGINFIVNKLKTLNVPLSKQVILDGGCGTGNYSLSLHKKGLTSLYCLDPNIGMLSTAASELMTFKGILPIIGSLLNLPLRDNSVDSVIINQVIHHLDSNKQRPNLKIALHEAYRVLKKDGYLIINTSTPDQQKYAFWWAQLIPKATAKAASNFPELDIIKAIGREAGFTGITFDLEKQEILQSKNYFDHRGPLKTEWRNTDSTWSLATKDEIKQAEITTKELIASGEIQNIIKKSEEYRAKHGQSVYISMKK
jgi:ubiquinone/menaquinone biosynthesis C-methylase UbiE